MSANDYGLTEREKLVATVAGITFEEYARLKLTPAERDEIAELYKDRNRLFEELLDDGEALEAGGPYRPGDM